MSIKGLGHCMVPRCGQTSLCLAFGSDATRTYECLPFPGLVVFSFSVKKRQVGGLGGGIHYKMND